MALTAAGIFVLGHLPNRRFVASDGRARIVCCASLGIFDFV
ncbi:hypothetical protein BQ8794_140432 [Mesorhizobium prunaredense]|uniref:Uncharacterized protein n=1 Tax=Mesorhizobium prunaredense TaxID=1631249 RepID=A0A1R3V343_9HYPH|nr:hypothetical protein BQ8794_140432 [Mesorhizobium prunaredense]